jgi:hypothetical protein
VYEHALWGFVNTAMIISASSRNGTSLNGLEATGTEPVNEDQRSWMKGLLIIQKHGSIFGKLKTTVNYS